MLSYLSGTERGGEYPYKICKLRLSYAGINPTPMLSFAKYHNLGIYTRYLFMIAIAI
ncbi:hypothetical protein [Komarekiella delphini-convector]|uniref:hypothetical protein n=1 Tax=Komarekiella delphini-convector TaxID=3050158 RepID=UPI00177C2C08|nr:hypothetical protein [Komarekiella delphini-convector]